MKLSRRCVAAGGVLAFAMAGLPSRAAGAQGGDETAVNQAIEDLRKAMIDADKARLEDLVADQLSYGHSGGVIETKEQFISRTKRRSTSQSRYLSPVLPSSAITPSSATSSQPRRKATAKRPRRV